MVKMNEDDRNEVTVDLDNVTLRYGNMEPVVIPRVSLRTRLQLIEWVYRLAGWPLMNMRTLRAFIAAISEHHGWGLARAEDGSRDEALPMLEPASQLERAAQG